MVCICCERALGAVLVHSQSERSILYHEVELNQSYGRIGPQDGGFNVVGQSAFLVSFALLPVEKLDNCISHNFAIHTLFLKLNIA